MSANDCLCPITTLLARLLCIYGTLMVVTYAERFNTGPMSAETDAAEQALAAEASRLVAEVRPETNRTKQANEMNVFQEYRRIIKRSWTFQLPAMVLTQLQDIVEAMRVHPEAGGPANSRILNVSRNDHSGVALFRRGWVWVWGGLPSQLLKSVMGPIVCARSG